MYKFIIKLVLSLFYITKYFKLRSSICVRLLSLYCYIMTYFMETMISYFTTIQKTKAYCIYVVKLCPKYKYIELYSPVKYNGRIKVI